VPTSGPRRTRDTGVEGRQAVGDRQTPTPPRLWRSCGSFTSPQSFWVCVRSVPFACGERTLCLSIMNILTIRPKPKVFGVYATRIVATRAVMADEQAMWNWSVCQFPRKAVDIVFPFLSVYVQRAVSLIVRASCPQPARISFLNFRPQTLFPRWRIELSHSCDLPTSARAMAIPRVFPDEDSAADRTRLGNVGAACRKETCRGTVFSFRMLRVIDGHVTLGAYAMLGGHDRNLLAGSVSAMPRAGRDPAPWLPIVQSIAWETRT